MKVFLQPGLRGLSGGMGDWVYQLRNGKTVLGMKPMRMTSQVSEPSEAQVNQRERFRRAAKYGKLVMADDAIRPLYEQIAEARGMPVFAVCVADYFNSPSIDEIDAINYTGKAGNPIRIVASDDFGVARVNVVLSDEASGTLIENGLAVETPTGSGQWIYTTTETVDRGSTVQIQITAVDRPGGTAVQTGTKSI